MIAVLLSLWCYGGNGLSIHNKFRKLGKVPAGGHRDHGPRGAESARRAHGR